MGSTMTLSQFLAGTDPSDAESSTPAVLGSLAMAAAEFSGVRFQIPDGYLARELRGAKMRTVAGVFDEFAAAFQFPYYFGQNKDAFDECLRDLDEFVGAAPGYVAIVRDSAQLLADEPAAREWFTAAMTDCAVRWSRRGVRFRVVLQHAPRDLSAAVLTL
ncbi:hypothetical protein ABIA39_003818 [Nocardia sp. GAS34]|uniref:barstar family protein n=1 Tax=unclassified Nocardia TaxID=2637762 RepID=UPI003D241E99